MEETQLSHLMLDQSKDLIWIVNKDFELVYANKTYFRFMKEVTGEEKRLNESAFVKSFGEEDIELWKSYYTRAFNGEYFDAEEKYFSRELSEINYSQISFEPLYGDEQEIIAVSCRSKDSGEIVKDSFAVNSLMDASLDVFCSIDEDGNFVHVSAAALEHWGYSPNELIGKPYINFVLEEDVAKSIETEVGVRMDQDVKDFVNRFKKKDGEIAYNVWSATWVSSSKLVICVARDGKRKIEEEEKTYQSEQRFKALVQEGSDLIGILSAEGNYKYASPTSISVLGIAPEEFIGKSAFEFIHPDDVERTSAAFQQIATKNKVVVEPYRFLNGKKEWRWIEGVLTNMLDNPAVNGIVCNSRDITDRIKQDKEIELSQKRFEALVENSTDCVIILSPEGQTTYVSGSVKNILGYSPAEAMDLNIWDLCHPDDIAGSEMALVKTMENPGVPMKGYTARVKHKNGSWRWVEPIITNLLHDPAVNGIVDNFRDITEKVEEEQQLKLLESVITNTHDAILITEIGPLEEPGPKIIYVNEAFTKMTGYEAEEVIGKSPRMLQGPNSSKKELAKLERALRNWEPYEITIINYKKSGEEFWINFTVTPVADEKGLFTHFISIERDVTEQKNKELENELINSVSGIFHRNTDNNLAACLTVLCEHITQFGDFNLAEVWLPAVDTKSINRVANYSKGKAGSIFYEETKEIASCMLGEGLPGEVWKNKTTGIWGNTEGKWLPKRKAAAKKAGIEAIMGVPLKHKDEVIGVLLLGTEKTKSALEQFTGLLKKLKVVIGSELSRKKIEIELAQIFDFTPDMICMAGFDGYIKRINPAGLELLGYSLEEILSRPISSLVHEQDQLLTRDNQAKLYNGENLRNFENRYITKEGKIVWLSWTATSSPEHSVVYAVAKNITAEKNLRELNINAGRLAKIGSWEVDVVNKVVFWSDETHQLHGTDPKAFKPDLETSFDFYRSDFRNLVVSNFRECISTGKNFDFEAVIVTTEKKELWVRIMGNAEFVNGMCKRFYGSVQDINDRKQAETRLQSLADNLPGVVFQYLIYPDGTDEVKHVTKRSEEVWGFPAEEVIKNHKLVLERILAGGEVQTIRKSLAHSIETKTEWNARWKYAMPNGEMRIHMGYGSPNFLADGTVYFNSVILDVTQEVKKEELLEQVTKQAKIGSWSIDLVDEELYVSDVGRAILEVELNEKFTNSGNTIDFIREDFRSMAHSKLVECVKEGVSFDFEAAIVTRNKKEKWVRITGSGEIIEGRCRKVYGSLQDINSLRETENRLVSFSENLPGVIYQYLIHPDGSDSVRYVSKGAEQLWGFTAKQITENVGLLWNQVDAANGVGEVQKSVQASIETKTKWAQRYRYLMPSGELRTHMGRAIPTFLSDGTVLFNVITIDVTNEAKNEELLKQTTEIARIGSWEMDLLDQSQGSIYWSPMKKKIMEVDENYSPNLDDFLNFYIGESRWRIESSLENLVANGTEFDIEVLIRTTKGNERWVRAIGKSEMVNGVRTKIYGSCQDIHEVKIAALELERSLKALGDYKFSLDQSAIIAITDSRGVIISVNDNFCEISKYKEDEIIGKTHRLINSGHHPKEFFVNLWKTIASGKVWRGEIKNKAKDGSYYWVDTTIVPFLDEGNVPVQYLAIRFDITERKKAEQEKNNLQATLENSINEIYIFDPETFRFSYVNKGALLNLGYSEREIKQLTPIDLKPEFTETSFKKLIVPLVTGKEKKIRFYTNHKRKDGSLYPAEVHLQLVKEGKNKRFLAIILDITSRKKAEEDILMANERFEKVTEATNDAIWDWDIVNGTFYRSKAIEKFFGKDASKSLEIRDFWKDNFHVEDLELIQSSIDKAITDPKCLRWELEYRLFNNEGEMHFVIDRGIIVRNEKGEAIRMVGAMTDVTQQKQMELELKTLNQELKQHALQLEQSNEELEQFAFVASHDLQEPLRMISSFMDLLKRKYENQLDEKALKYIHFATDGASRMKEIILDLLDYSRAGRVQEDNVSIDLNQVLEDYRILRRRLIEEKDVLILSDKLPLVNSCKAPLTQTIHCILDNAIKYSKEDEQPKIEIRVTENENEWIVSLKDNGIGIEEQFFDKIFVIFQRLHNKDQYDGTGIGLSIAKKNVELCNGKIWVESVVNEGSIFYFTVNKNKL